MVLLQHKLNLKVSQKQILTPGLVQMVSVLALNKLELKDMINAEMIENPVLDEYMDSVPTLDEIGAKEEQRERDSAVSEDAPPAATTPEEKDPFEEVDFGSFFNEYLDPGYRSSTDFEAIDKPSFENFLSKPTTLTDHLMWQLGAMNVKDDVCAAAELVIGNLSDDGYLLATDEELLALGTVEGLERAAMNDTEIAAESAAAASAEEAAATAELQQDEHGISNAPAFVAEDPSIERSNGNGTRPQLVPKDSAVHGLFGRDALHEAIDIVRRMDPVGVASRDLRTCLLSQIIDLQERFEENGGELHMPALLEDSYKIIDSHLVQIQNKQFKEVAKALGCTVERVNECMEKLIRRLDPKPGLRYNKVETRLIEPDVAFVKQGDDYLVVMNDEDLPQLRLNPTYKKLLAREAAEKDVRNYVKERYKSAIQLIKNIEQRKQTILKVCLAIIGRQRDFLDHGIDQLKPMMIKEVAEEIGVHPSTVSRAVANKYVHTSQGVFELRYFFSESVQGPEGGGTSLLILKRRVKKLIEEEDPARPLTDEQITRILQSQGIQVTRRTVAKYREDMKIPSTHQRRVKN
jgi:RNA polymerase sigma-54 factor